LNPVIGCPSRKFKFFSNVVAFSDHFAPNNRDSMSVADNRQLRVKTGQHLFIYRSQERQLFAKGMTAVNLRSRNILIATPEKALLDTIAWHRINTKTITPAGLFEDICNSYRLNGALFDGTFPQALNRHQGHVSKSGATDVCRRVIKTKK
jgi:hypothetical protein